MKPKARPKETVMWFIVGPGGVIQWDICRDGEDEAVDSFAALVDLDQKQLHDKGYRAVKCKVVPL